LLGAAKPAPLSGPILATDRGKRCRSRPAADWWLTCSRYCSGCWCRCRSSACRSAASAPAAARGKRAAFRPMVAVGLGAGWLAPRLPRPSRRRPAGRAHRRCGRPRARVADVCGRCAPARRWGAIDTRASGTWSSNRQDLWPGWKAVLRQHTDSPDVRRPASSFHPVGRASQMAAASVRFCRESC